MFITVEVLKDIRTIYPNLKILLCWDSTHRGSEVLKFIKEDGKIEIIFFPKYA